ncbi:sphingomyelin synthase 1, putative (SMS1) [Plasmodium ovale wallikeri]|uniref:Sphingomyelin synthase 1, putative (SMS1) n=1 Tax=Plasmodium ovale wallikeri TaxID=864142 RepID=A0A1A8Z488_PLAOA|nr:sphingomyelin synthase 1, putative (SMS1) [Plasmodium ovale wallikeri]
MREGHLSSRPIPVHGNTSNGRTANTGHDRKEGNEINVEDKENLTILIELKNSLNKDNTTNYQTNFIDTSNVDYNHIDAYSDNKEKKKACHPPSFSDIQDDILIENMAMPQRGCAQTEICKRICLLILAYQRTYIYDVHIFTKRTHPCTDAFMEEKENEMRNVEVKNHSVRRKMCKIIFVRLLYTMLFFLIAVFIQCYFIILSDNHYKTGEQPLKDRVHEMYKEIPSFMNTVFVNSNILFLLILTFLRFGLFFPILLSLSIFIRFTTMLSFIYCIRSIFIYVTTLPCPIPTCQPMKNKSFMENLYTSYLIITAQVYECTDLIISGHTAFTTILKYMWFFYEKNIYIKIAIFFYVMYIFALIIISKFHYTVDVLMGYVFGAGIFICYHGLLDVAAKRYAINRSFSAKVPKMRVSHFCLFCDTQLCLFCDTQLCLFCHTQLCLFCHTQLCLFCHTQLCLFCHTQLYLFSHTQSCVFSHSQNQEYAVSFVDRNVVFNYFIRIIAYLEALDHRLNVSLSYDKEWVCSESILNAHTYSSFCPCKPVNSKGLVVKKKNANNEEYYDFSEHFYHSYAGNGKFNLSTLRSIQNIIKHIFGRRRKD